jgi:peptidoglycan/LPS O-acetylase OafA/YrhL
MSFSPRERYRHIDTLRGIAASGVVIFHLRAIADGGPLPVNWWIEPVLYLGDSGVSLFFALSGFLLTLLMPSNDRHANPLLAFYIKRFFRIAPLFYCMFLFWGLYRVLNGGPFFWPADKVVTSLSLAFNLIPSEAHGVIFAGWTIGVEALFYVVFPLLFFTFRSLWAGAALIAAAFAGSIIFNSIVSHSGMPAPVIETYNLISMPRHLPAFAMGMFAARLYPVLDERPDKAALGAFLICVSCLIFAGILSDRLQNVLVDTRHWRSMGAAFFLVGFVLCPLTLWSGATSFLGRISFSVYLMHGVVIKFMGATFLAIYAFGLPDWLSFFAACIAAFLVVVPVSWCTYTLIERPGMAVGARLIDRLDRGAARYPLARPQEAL